MKEKTVKCPAIRDWLRRRMETRGIKSINVIEAQSRTPISHGSLFDYYHGYTRPTPQKAEILSDFFHEDPTYLSDLLGYHIGKTHFPGQKVPGEWDAEFRRIAALPEDLQLMVWTVVRQQLDVCESMANMRGLARDRELIQKGLPLDTP